MGQGTFTDNQWLAIQTRNCDLLVAAAAGSGKTAVLVERIIQMITDSNHPVNIDQLLVVTFTKAAAAEMKTRIGDALAKALTLMPDNTHLQNQLTLLNRANIKTIHAFCLQVIKEHYYLLGIDPQTRTADPAESILLQQETLDNLFESLYAQEDNAPFLELVERFAENSGDRQLKALILRLYTFLTGCPNPRQWLIDQCAALKTLAEEGFEKGKWMPLLLEAVQADVAFAQYYLQAAKSIAQEDEGFAGYLHTITKELDAIDAFLQQGLCHGYEHAYHQLSLLEFGRLSAYRGEEKETAEEIKNLRTAAKKLIDKMKERFFPCSPETSQRHISRLWPVADALCQVTLQFMDWFQQAKRDKQILDFGDYEHYCLELLVEKGSTVENIIPTPAALAISEEYAEILIDEYQDSNVIQEMLLSAISRQHVQANNRFMVGDVKQSIYGFRLAAPELFMEKYNHFPIAMPDRKPTLTQKIVLSQNFRSRANVLEGANFLFCQMMSAEVGGIVYDEEAALYPAAHFPDCTGICGGANEILLIDTASSKEEAKEEAKEVSPYLEDLTRRELEAQLIAKRIKALFTEGFLVLDKNTREYRPLEFGDIAILLRSMAAWEGVFEKIFVEEEIPYFAETSAGYYDAPEVVMALHFLQLIDNPMQDISLMSVLHHPLYGFSADDLMNIRLALAEGMPEYPTFYDALEGYVAQCAAGNQEVDQSLGRRIEEFLVELENWRDYAGEYSISQLLWYLYDATGYYDYVGVQSGGKLRQANLRLLIEKAEQYEQTSRKGLFYFVKYIEQMKKAGADETGGVKATEGGNLVQIMTIHKSKGLEFPVVFVSDMGKGFNHMDSRDPLLLHQELGIAFDDMDIANRVLFKTLARSALAEQLKRQNISEEMRVLYVALTRAKEKLILTGSVKDFGKQASLWRLVAEGDGLLLPTFFMARASGYLDWIMPAFFRHKDAKGLWKELGKQQPAFCQKWMGRDSNWYFDCFPKEQLNEIKNFRKKAAVTLYESFANWDVKKDYSGQKEEIVRRLRWQYPYQDASRLPSKISISEIKRRQLDSQEDVANLFLPPKESLIKKQTELSQTAIGVAVHTLLEHCDFRRHYTQEEMEQEILGLQNTGKLSDLEAAAIDSRAVAAFFDSPLAKRLRNSNSIFKEQPFAMTVTPKELGLQGIDPIAENEQILVNGIIDCYFYEDNHIILLDYKTDRIYKGQEALLIKRYGLQLSLYKQALERITGRKVQESYIYSIGLSKAILLEG